LPSYSSTKFVLSTAIKRLGEAYSAWVWKLRKRFAQIVNSCFLYSIFFMNYLLGTNFSTQYLDAISSNLIWIAQLNAEPIRL
jgi:hypothetical protein